MRKTGRGTILYTTGGAAINPYPLRAGVGISFAGEVAYARMLHDEVKEHGIHVAHTAIGGRIAPGGDHEPDDVAEILWRHHTERDAFQTRIGVGSAGTGRRMNPTYDFDGQVAVVTGAGSGMGLDTARAFAAAGAAVALADIDEDVVRTATDELTADGHQALGVTCDVADEDQVAALVDRTVAEFGRLDMAFNNAGIMLPPSDAADEPAEQLRPRQRDQPARGVGLHEARTRARCASKAAARSSTARRSAGWSATPAAPPTTPPSTASSA